MVLLTYVYRDATLLHVIPYTYVENKRCGLRELLARRYVGHDVLFACDINRAETVTCLSIQQTGRMNVRKIDRRALRTIILTAEDSKWKRNIKYSR